MHRRFSLIILLTHACTEPSSDAALGGSTGTSAPTTDDPSLPTDAPAPDLPAPDGSTDLATTDPAESSGAADTTIDTAASPVCGDGVLDPGEQCDDTFAANLETGACLPDCTKAACGDGHVQAGVEKCDLGENNSHDFGSCNPLTCQWGPRCGDGIVTPTYELCDPGAPIDPKDGEVLACGQDCRFEGRIVFITSDDYDGMEVNSVVGADLKCQNLAKTFDPQRFYTYRAWLSDDAHEPAATFDHATVPYVLLNGVVVASSFDGLVQSGPAVGITITEAHQSLINARVWTHTTHAGITIPNDHHCAQWTSNDTSLSAMSGRNALPADSPDLVTWAEQRWWTTYLESWCDQRRHLYCFEN